jgi:signal peptidase I
VVVGQREPAAQRGSEFCPNCGSFDLGLDRVPVTVGDQLLVNKNVFDWRRPRRWEMVVFRCPAEPDRAFVKRVVALPGETVQIKNGDVFVDHDLARKTLAELRAVRIPVFDLQHTAHSAGREDRWETADSHTAGVDDDSPYLRTVSRPDTYHWLVYRHQVHGKARAVCDEYGYNGADIGPLPEPVHDFVVECEVDVCSGPEGWFALRITDGADELMAELPVGTAKDGTKLSDVRRPQRVYRTAPEFTLRPGRSYRVELAFADRRVMLAVDGVPVFAACDRPAVEQRNDVITPFQLGARGVEVRVRSVKLWRDIHYTDAGRHGSRSPVRLGSGEYFVLGDNSPNSDDNRFWTGRDNGPLPVRESDLLGKPFLVHMPSRAERWRGLGGEWESQALDWERIRWLR